MDYPRCCLDLMAPDELGKASRRRIAAKLRAVKKKLR